MSPYERFDTYVAAIPKHRDDSVRSPRSRSYEPRHAAAGRPRPSRTETPERAS